jgi:hypothetical protein
MIVDANFFYLRPVLGAAIARSSLAMITGHDAMPF